MAGMLAEIEAAVRARNAPQLRIATHTLKGALSYFTAREPLTAAQSLEALARNAKGAERVLRGAGDGGLAAARDGRQEASRAENTEVVSGFGRTVTHARAHHRRRSHHC